MYRPLTQSFVLLIFSVALLAFVRADDEPIPAGAKPDESPKAENPADSAVDTKEAAKSSLVKLSKDHPIWIDTKRKLVVVEAEVCLREGQLEMFACPSGSKEHESIISVNCPAQFVHAGLLAVGAKVGHPVKYDPKYVPAAGTEIELVLLWKDKDGKKKQARAQEWIKHVKTGKQMEYPWVFAGSGFWTDETTGERFYHADAGDFICVSNFTTAMLDLPVKSSRDNADLVYVAFTNRIPPLKTKVKLVLIPKKEKKAGENKDDDAEKKNDKPAIEKESDRKPAVDKAPAKQDDKEKE